MRSRSDGARRQAEARTRSQLVHIAVDAVQPHVLVEIGLQILHRRNLALRLAYPRNDKVAQDAVPDRTEADAVIYAAEDNLGSVLERPLNAGDGITRFLERLRALVKVKPLLTGILVYPLTGPDFEPDNLIGVGRHAYRLQLPELAAALVCDDHAHCAAAVLLLAYKHAIKIHISALRHPSHHDKFSKLLILT